MCGDSSKLFLKDATCLDNISPRLAFYYVAFFKLLRMYTSSFVASNPTWIKQSANEGELIKKAFKIICVDYLSVLEKLSLLMGNYIDTGQVIIQRGDSRNIRLADESVDCIITSPPYCTRIDYAIYTRVELALIGYSGVELDYIRRDMLGTPTIRHEHAGMSGNAQHWSDLLHRIMTHNSKASGSYYYKTFSQYFHDMEQSLSEIHRVIKPRAILVMVLQDSWFKDIHIDLPDIVRKSLENRNFDLISLHSETVVTNMRYINTNSRKYGNKGNTETVLTMMKRS
jgi:DNA modification methylase